MGLKISDVNKKLDIFGIEFDMNFDENYVEKLKKIDINKIDNEISGIYEIVNTILADDNAVNKIKTVYEKESGKLFSGHVLIQVLAYVMQEYINEVEKCKVPDVTKKRR